MSKNTAPSTAPALKPSSRCMRSRTLRAVAPPKEVDRKLAAANRTVGRMMPSMPKLRPSARPAGFGGDRLRRSRHKPNGPQPPAAGEERAEGSSGAAPQERQHLRLPVGVVRHRQLGAEDAGLPGGFDHRDLGLVDEVDQ